VGAGETWNEEFQLRLNTTSRHSPLCSLFALLLAASNSSLNKVVVSSNPKAGALCVSVLCSKNNGVQGYEVLRRWVV